MDSVDGQQLGVYRTVGGTFMEVGFWTEHAELFGVYNDIYGLL